MSEKWNIMCRVYGGITGLRESLLKFQGEPQEFDSESEAQIVCDNLDKNANTEHAKADFEYWPIKAGTLGAIVQEKMDDIVYDDGFMGTCDPED